MRNAIRGQDSNIEVKRQRARKLNSEMEDRKKKIGRFQLWWCVMCTALPPAPRTTHCVLVLLYWVQRGGFSPGRVVLGIPCSRSQVIDSAAGPLLDLQDVTRTRAVVPVGEANQELAREARASRRHLLQISAVVPGSQPDDHVPDCNVCHHSVRNGAWL
jgi:hypothetical protein